MATVMEVVIRCDVVGLGYRIVMVEQDKKAMWAFVWGNIRASVGDCLPAMENTAEEGYEIFQDEISAEEAYSRVADGLIRGSRSDAAIGHEMLARM